MNNFYEAVFVWPDTSPQDVILTGSFDQWSASLHLTKVSNGFEGKVEVPWGTRISYKFIVDGNWMTLQSQPQESDNLGNLNNIYDSPCKPEETPVLNNELEDDPVPEELPSVDIVPPLATSDAVSSQTKSPGPYIENTSVSASTLDIIPISESTALPSSDAPAVIELTTSPTTYSVEDALQRSQSTNPSGAKEEVNIPSREPVVTPNIDGIPKPNSDEKQTGAVQFPLSELAQRPDPIIDEPKPSTESPQVNLDKTIASTESVESELKTPSLVPSSAPSSPASPLRGMFQQRQRSISSKSNSVRSESSRSKRPSLFGKVKSLFLFDKDSS